MKKALGAFSNVLLALFVLLTISGVALDLMMLRAGEGTIRLLRGVHATLTDLPVPGSNVSPGSLSVVQRLPAGQAKPGEAVVAFDNGGRAVAGVLRQVQGGQAVLDVNGQPLTVDERQVKARFRWVLPNAGVVYALVCAPWFIAATGVAVFLVFVLVRLDWRRRPKALSPTDDEISTMFR